MILLITYCNTLDNLSSMDVFQMKQIKFKIACFSYDTVINESERLIKHTSCNCECKFDGRNCNLSKKWKNH